MMDIISFFLNQCIYIYLHIHTHIYIYIHIIYIKHVQKKGSIDFFLLAGRLDRQAKTMVESRVRMPRKNTERSWDKNHGADDTGGYTHM